ncbi:TMEM175 family protein [Deinococcus sp. KSM4-11]|uniref:TMEM175 family protein n=1 Tax=Deinococcus sp. KSM4-11 TaxID=2568654 RepID=UPI00197AF431|nr:TMEM175 family protein [Deinococcus sp. KSM4-11]
MMTKSRMEAFSDGVLAIIITIMVLELRVPEGHDWHELGRLWPKFLAYVISFVYVGIYWNNHHHLMHTVHRVTGGMLWANLHLLFWLSLFPFVSGWAGESHFAREPMTAYGVVALMAGLAYTILVRVIIGAGTENHLLADAIGEDVKGNLSLAGYVVAIVAPLLGAWGAWVSGVMLIGVALMWLIPDRRIEQVLQRERH